MSGEEYDELKRNVAYLKRVVCTAEPSCASWRRGDFCLFPGELRIGRMGTCLSMEPTEPPIIINRPLQKGARYLP